MSLRGGLLFFPTKQSPIDKEIARNDMGVRMTQTIDTKTVKHVANLVRLGITEEEAQTFSGQFSSIIDYFTMLNEVDTENVPPASDIANAENVLREDVVKPSMSHAEFIKNAPNSERGYVKVPTVLGEE
jgi:aspartyl-tRNA(Asn)/glutamyl-tRNA(Gln) amidotransferase subunit C